MTSSIRSFCDKMKLAVIGILSMTVIFQLSFYRCSIVNVLTIHGFLNFSQIFQSFAAHVPEPALNHISDLEQLDDYSLMHIFDHLHLADLMTIAQIRPRFSDIIIDHYIIAKFHMHEHELIINVESDYRALIFNTEDRRLYIAESFDKLLSVLMHFGHIFNQLTYEITDFGTPSLEKIVEYVDKYCPQAKKAIFVVTVDRDALANWSYSIEITTPSIGLSIYVPQAFPLNDLFPRMEELKMEKIIESAVEYFPNLTKCSFESVLHPGSYKKAYEMIRLNPQLHSFKTMITNNASFVSYINEMLPNLQSLSFDFFNVAIVAEMVRFTRVTEFSLDLSYCGADARIGQAIDNIKFDELKNLKIRSGFGRFDANLKEMVRENRGLTSLAIDFSMTRTELTELIQILPDLEELSIYWRSVRRVQILDMMEFLLIGNHKMNQINVYELMQANEFVEITPLNWRIAKINRSSSDISFIRMD